MQNDFVILYHLTTKPRVRWVWDPTNGDRPLRWWVSLATLCVKRSE